MNRSSTAMDAVDSLRTTHKCKLNELNKSAAQTWAKNKHGKLVKCITNILPYNDNKSPCDEKSIVFHKGPIVHVMCSVVQSMDLNF